ncbi:MAG TPA: 2-C-methyl-D-erythritol 4-phosphate cytidylyltransferase [Chlamydiales bacterium]|nr:2-C-methyl-D-erythritol 4-phosphate cytidylyltransferase [Chlamydiales bacterium]
MFTTSLILLAGGKGSRFGGTLPKQYLSLLKKPVALHSFDLFLEIPTISEIVVVCEPHYQHFFSSSSKPIAFALPGERRQDSVFSGLQKTTCDVICIHDAARPFPEKSQVIELLKDAFEIGASALGVPVSNTMKECTSFNQVVKTVPRSSLWEIQTPQAIKRDLLTLGFQKAYRENIEVTDDVALIELLRKPVKITMGSKKNIKITTPFDLELATFLCERNTN